MVVLASDSFGGAGRGSRFDTGLPSRVDKGRFVYPAGLDTVHAWAYLPDLALAFVRIAEQHAQLHGRHRLHFAGHAVTGEQMREAMQAAAGRVLRPAGLPWGALLQTPLPLAVLASLRELGLLPQPPASAFIAKARA